MLADQVEDVVRHWSPVPRHHFAARLGAMPLDLDPGGLDDAQRRVGHFGADAVSGEQRDVVFHQKPPSVSTVWARARSADETVIGYSNPLQRRRMATGSRVNSLAALSRASRRVGCGSS